MYIRREKKQKPRILRVLILTDLILLGLFFIRYQPDWARPFEPIPTPTREATSYVNEGDIYFAEGKLQKAIEAYEEAIALEPDNDIPYIRQAKLLIYHGNTAKALIRAEQAMLLNPYKAENLAGYCQALDWEGQYAAATEACECALEIDPDYASGHAYLSEVYADQGYWIPARSTAEDAIAADFQNPDAHHNMGYALELQGRYAEASEFFENAITLKPKLAFYYLSAGRNYYWLGHLDKASDRFGEAIKLDPTNPVGYDQLGWTYHSNGQHIRAIDALEQAISVNPLYARAWGRLGTIYYLRQNYEEAVKILPTAITLAEQDALAKVRRIEILTEVEGLLGPEQLPILQGRFAQGDLEGQPNLLIARLTPIQWLANSVSVDSVNTCGDLIAQKIENQIVQVSPTHNTNFSNVFSQTTGIAYLNLANGDLNLKLSEMPHPPSTPYGLQITYQSNETEHLGYFQPDRLNEVNETLKVNVTSGAPEEYYYELGLSYAYATPRQCAKALPWLLKSLEYNSAYYNPAWEGLKLCPTEDSPPTPLPTFTPFPE